MSVARSTRTGRSASSGAADGSGEETAEEKIARLSARVAELEASENKLTTKREFLRSAAKYFAGETNW